MSAMVLGPPVLLAAEQGGLPFDVLIGLAAVILSWEWNRLCGRGMGLMATLVTTTCLGAVVFAALGSPQQALALIAVSGATIAFLTMVGSQVISAKSSFIEQPRWLAAGIFYIGVPCVALIWLRNFTPSGREAILWIFAVVWAVDIGAYFFGRGFGGPKLAPKISPNKTWAGLIGGMFCAALVGAEAALLMEKEQIALLAAFSAAMAVVEQGGDLLESWIKRRFSVKDMGSLIPGHGGLFDRVDGLLAVGAVSSGVAMAAGGDLFQWL